MATVKKPVMLNETGQEIVEVLREVKTAIASGKAAEATTWKEVQANVRNGLGPTLYPVGTKFVIYKYNDGATKSGEALKYTLDVSDHDKHFLLRHGVKTANYSMTLQFHELINGAKQFDAPEDQYGLSLDTSVVSWKTYYSDTAGTKVTSPTGSPKDNGYYEQNDTSQYKRSSYGSNNWRHSGIRKWLNASPTVAAGSWWTKTTACDKISALASYLPFQAMLADDASGSPCTLLDVIGPVTINTILNTIKNPDNSDYYLDADANGNYAVASRLSYDTTEDTFFLPSTKEIHCSGYNEADGVVLNYYEKFSDYASPIGLWSVVDTNLLKHYQNSNSSANWWLRSAYAPYSNDVMLVYSGGSVGSHGAYDSIGVAPLCVIY